MTGFPQSCFSAKCALHPRWARAPLAGRQEPSAAGIGGEEYCQAQRDRRDLGLPEATPAPHVHVLLTCGAFTPDGEFLELPELDMARLEAAWQEAVFALYI